MYETAVCEFLVFLTNQALLFFHNLLSWHVHWGSGSLRRVCYFLSTGNLVDVGQYRNTGVKTRDKLICLPTIKTAFDALGVKPEMDTPE